MQKGKESRRAFLVKGGKASLAAVGVWLLGNSLTSSLMKKAQPSPTISSKPQGPKGERVLVAYESRFGSTAEVATFIGQSLIESGEEVDIMKIPQVEDLSPYRQVIVGSAIQYDKWMPEAREFVAIHEAELATKSTSFFLVCLALSKGTEKAREQVEGYSASIKALVPGVKVSHFGKFAGVLDYSKMPWGLKLLALGLFAVLGVKEGDYRDWDAIAAWAKRLS